MRQLLWKEWHEQSWKLGFGCIVLGALALLAFHARLLADETTAMWICTIGMTLLPLLASTGLIPAEREEGTLEMLLSLPVPPWRLLVAKMVVGVSLVALPLLLAALVAVLICGDREVPAVVLFELHIRCIATAVALFAWMVALTARLPSEARAAMIAVGVLILWELITIGLHVPSGFAPLVIPYAAAPFYRLIITPMVFVFGFSDGFVQSPPLALSIATQLLISVGLLLMTIRRLNLNHSAV